MRGHRMPGWGAGKLANNNNRRILSSGAQHHQTLPGDLASPNHQLSPLIFEIPRNLELGYSLDETFFEHLT